MDDICSLKPDFKRAGSLQRCCCIYHKENTPSMYYYAEDNHVHCFSCHRSWNAIDIVEEERNMTFPEAVRYLLEHYDVSVNIKDIYEKQTNEDVEREGKREVQFQYIKKVHQFYVNEYHKEYKGAVDCRNYAEIRANNPDGRWQESFCNEFGMGYAPAGGHALVDWARANGLDLDVLVSIGIIGEVEKDGVTTGRYYDIFRDRLVIPQRNRNKRVHAFTARVIHDNGDEKYKNNKCTSGINLIYQKGESVFGIDRAFGAGRKEEIVYLMEGAPDVIGLNTLGIMNAAATNGGYWNANQLSTFRSYMPELCFIPDSDLGTKDVYGVAVRKGHAFVMESGVKALELGFSVKVKEIPCSDEEKRDVDSYITSIEIFKSLEEENFVIWYARKLLGTSRITYNDLKKLARICDLAAMIASSSERHMVISHLKEIYGDAKLWNKELESAISRYNDRRRDEKLKESDQRLSKYGLILHGHGYNTLVNGKEQRGTNFTMEGKYLISDNDKSFRIIEFDNGADSFTKEVAQSTISSIDKFKNFLMCQGNFRLWCTKGEQYDNILDFVADSCITAYPLKVMGWNKRGGFFAWANGISVDGVWNPIDKWGMVTKDDTTYYLPAFAEINQHEEARFLNVRRFEHVCLEKVSMSDFFSMVVKMYGNNGIISLLFVVSTLYRDIIIRTTKFFPMLYLFGPKGTGKTAFATLLTKLFQREEEITNLISTSLYSLGEKLGQGVNIIVHLDEYKRGIIGFEKVDMMKGAHNSSGRTVRSDSTNERSQTLVACGLVVTGQDIPDDDPALLSRTLFLETYQRVRSTGESNTFYTELQEMVDKGLTCITIDLLKYRNKFDENFKKYWLKALVEIKDTFKDSNIDERQLACWSVPYATILCYNAIGVQFPFNKKKVKEICIEAIGNQDEVTRTTDEIANFWIAVVELHNSGAFKPRQAFIIEPLKKDLPLKRDRHSFSLQKELYPGRMLYLNFPLVWKRIKEMYNRDNNPFNESTLLSYLQHSSEYLGKMSVQKSFTAYDMNGNRIIQRKFNKKKGTNEDVGAFNPERALVFDYEKLKVQNGIILERVIMTKNAKGEIQEEYIEEMDDSISNQ